MKKSRRNHKKSSRKSSRKSLHKSIRRSPDISKRKISSGRRKCNQILSAKIKKNMEELKSGRYKSRSQAIAVSYSQVKKSHPKCKRYFTRK